MKEGEGEGRKKCDRLKEWKRRVKKTSSDPYYLGGIFRKQRKNNGLLQKNKDYKNGIEDTSNCTLDTKIHL